MKNKYVLLFKTGDAEFRALKNTDFDRSKVQPIIELTRGRKSKLDKVGLISKRIKSLEKIFANQSICLDLTAHESLSNSEIDELYKFEKGYKNWVSFLIEIKEHSAFKEIIPTILVDTTDEDIEKNLLKQVRSLGDNFNKIVYRNSIADDGCYEDIDAIKDYINENIKLKFIFAIDCEYVPSGAYLNTIEIANARFEKIKNKIPKAEFIIVSTSFPRYVSDIGDDEHDSFPLNEIDIFNGIKRFHNNVIYGDYASINPIRNDDIVMARGWIPRIDIPTAKEIYYYRERRNGNDYPFTYTKVAKKVFRDEKFPQNLNKNWGIRQVLSCKDGSAPGSSPSFWISVRMSIHIDQRLIGIDEMY
ncbi:MAG: beta family protein [Prolixibacteraceae bacterium]